jgi:hypothetical protein
MFSQKISITAHAHRAVKQSQKLFRENCVTNEQTSNTADRHAAGKSPATRDDTQMLFTISI